MSFNVLYVENDHKIWDLVEKAVKLWNETSEGEEIIIERANSPDDIKKKLNFRFDLILADVFYDDPVTNQRDVIDRLDDIIKYVKEWGKEQRGGKPLPIIVYTGYTKVALDSCLRRKDSLYDIWDKNTASPDYVAWRLSKISGEMSRIRPDAKLQQFIKGMNSGARWHDSVIDMVTSYDSGWTEQDQIDRVKTPILNIARSIGVQDLSQQLWDLMIKWESFSRAASRQIRGHARHVINVFWLGYFLLHNEHLKSIFETSWGNLLASRAEMQAVLGKPALEALSDAWFFGGLFHDVGGCVEKCSVVNDELQKMLSVFADLAPSKVNLNASKVLVNKAESLFFEFGEPLGNYLRDAFEQSVKINKPDQGILAALLFRQKVLNGEKKVYAREGGRAAALHNLFPSLKESEEFLPINWLNDPIVCLLLLCDQIQTWDRERGDEMRWDDAPSRAELFDLKVEKVDHKPIINIHINYVAPRHLTYNPDIYDREKVRLNLVLQNHPEKALKRIQGPWPFSLKVNFSFSGDPLTTKIMIE